MPVDSGRYPSGQRGQTVNLLANAFGGSNPPLPTTSIDEERPGLVRALPSVGDLGAMSGPPWNRLTEGVSTRGNSSAVERQPSKLGVAGSNPVSRSRFAGIEHRTGCAGPVASVGGFGGHVGASLGSIFAHVAQMAERVLGKDEVSGSIPDMGSMSSTGPAVPGRLRALGGWGPCRGPHVNRTGRS
jgi:hypothetical protein